VEYRVWSPGQGKPMAPSPYGFWRSPVTSDFVVADSIRLEQVALDGDVLYWSETQPQKKGRSFVYLAAKSGGPEPVTPDDDNGVSVRTRVHEYGGGSFAVSDGTSISRTTRISDSIARTAAGSRGRSRLHRSRAPPMRCAMPMASSTGSIAA
jgi:hypothetical protein